MFLFYERLQEEFDHVEMMFLLPRTNTNGGISSVIVSSHAMKIDGGISLCGIGSILHCNQNLKIIIKHRLQEKESKSNKLTVLTKWLPLSGAKVDRGPSPPWKFFF